jgi:hypothetical protein
LGQRKLAERGDDPQRLSPALAIRALQHTLRDYRLRPKSAAETLWNRLSLAQLDDRPRHPSKTSSAGNGGARQVRFLFAAAAVVGTTPAACDLAAPCRGRGWSSRS